MEMIPCHFKATLVDAYDGNTNLYNHVESYKALKILQEVSDAMLYNSFLVILWDAARALYTRL